MNKVVKGYKVFNSDFTCLGMQFKEGETFEHKGNIEICVSGLHFCLKAFDCFSYYDFTPTNIVCEVEALGDVQYKDDDSKGCTNILKIIRRLDWQEVLSIVNEGMNNTGHSNSGYRNSGNWNSGYRNSGYRNSGNWNSGDSNSGDSNSGYRNSGNWNSGNWNSGNKNSGDSNSGYRNSGAFSNDKEPLLYLFNKPTNISVVQWEEHKVISIMSNLNFTLWVPSNMMSDEEIISYPEHETTGGYIKVITLKEAWSNLWGNLSDENKNVFLTLPNFDAEIFEDITGIKTN